MSQRAVILTVLLLATLLVPHSTTIAQQIEATVTVNYEAVATTNKDLLQDFKSDIETYLNNYTWNDDGNQNDKIKCNFDIFIKGVVGEDRYSAQVFVGSRRNLYKSEKTSAVLRIFDETWEFAYVRNRSIIHNRSTFNDLASVLDFYVYVIIGYDYDTYDKLSGTPYFQRAADISSLGRSSGQKGWQPSSSGYSRAQFSDDLNDNKFAAVRSASYHYHFAGLDTLSLRETLANVIAAFTKLGPSNKLDSLHRLDSLYQARGWTNILKALDVIARTKTIVDPRNVVIKAFFDSKYMELADTFLLYPDRAVYIKLSNIDPAHIKTYEEYRNGKNGG